MKGLVCFSLSSFLWAFHFARTTSVHGFLFLQHDNRQLPRSSKRCQLPNRSILTSARDLSGSVILRFNRLHGNNNNNKISSFGRYSSLYNSSGSGSYRNLPNQDYGVIIPEDGYGSPCVIKVSTVLGPYKADVKFFLFFKI
jgi:hypothetical protein